MLIYIIRHGETKANVDGVLQGWDDFPLNENGRKLAAITGRNMSDIRFDRCISSPLIRAKETAKIVLGESGNDIPIEEDERIKEINFGDYEKKSIKVPEMKQFFADPFLCPQFPNGESVRMVISRTYDFLRELMELDDGKTYLVATHGCALRAMLNHFYEDKDNYWHGHVPYNCCVNIIEAAGGNAHLIADDKIYYPPELVADRYKGGKS